MPLYFLLLGYLFLYTVLSYFPFISAYRTPVRSLGWQFFSTLNISATAFWYTSKFLLRNFLVIWLMIPCTWQVTFLATFKILSVFPPFDYSMSQRRYLWTHPTWSLLSSLGVYNRVFLQIGERFAPASSDIFSSLSFLSSQCGAPPARLWVRLMVPHRLLGSLYFSSVFFPYSLDLVVSIILSLNSLIPLFLQTQSCHWVPLIKF